MDSLKLEFREPRRKEIINGKIYMMAGTSVEHGDATRNLMLIFGGYLRGKKCRVFGEGIKVKFDEDSPETLPDVKIVCDPNKLKKNHIEGAPDFIAEILCRNISVPKQGAGWAPVLL